MFKFIFRSSKKARRLHFLSHKNQALSIVHARISYFNSFYNYKYNRISIKNVKTRWGSCSKRGNINFNYKIALIPSDLADYIIVHELCHIGELNHSGDFWNLVEKTIPDYREKRARLKEIKFI